LVLLVLPVLLVGFRGLWAFSAAVFLFLGTGQQAKQYRSVQKEASQAHAHYCKPPLFPADATWSSPQFRCNFAAAVSSS
jgi:hypothetical protein